MNLIDTEHHQEHAGANDNDPDEIFPPSASTLFSTKDE